MKVRRLFSFWKTVLNLVQNVLFRLSRMTINFKQVDSLWPQFTIFPSSPITGSQTGKKTIRHFSRHSVTQQIYPNDLMPLIVCEKTKKTHEWRTYHKLNADYELWDLSQLHTLEAERILTQWNLNKEIEKRCKAANQFWMKLNFRTPNLCCTNPSKDANNQSAHYLSKHHKALLSSLHLIFALSTRGNLKDIATLVILAKPVCVCSSLSWRPHWKLDVVLVC